VTKPARPPDRIRIPSPSGPLVRPFFICEIAVRRRRRITHARLLEVLHYDSETGEFRWIERMSRSVKAGDIAGTLHTDGYRRIRIKGRDYLAHHLAWLYMIGQRCSAFIDHSDGDPSNNRWNNLRRATASQNGANARRHRNNGCGFKGVSRTRGRWCARIYKHRRRYHLGIFSTPQEAHAAYMAAARKLFGEFARAE
jgi:HNH endonuclease/AP2 domain